jgi:tetratricopeptide (TPR) repeat protein
MPNTGKLFISHSSQDDKLVRELQHALGDLDQDVWVDSRELRGGNPLETEIKKAINEASAYAVLVSPAAFQSKWVGKELRHALLEQERRGKDQFPVIPLSLDNTKLGVLEEFFSEEPIYIPISSEAGGIEAALDAILVALGKRLPTDSTPTKQTKAEPLEELVLELTDLKIYAEEGLRRATGKARLVYEPANPLQPHVHSLKNWRFIAPIGPIEAEELRWYLEKYAIWPSNFFNDRVKQVKANLIAWGKLLYQAALPVEHTHNVLQAWAKIDDQAGRRFSVHVDKELEDGASKEEEDTAQAAATLLLGLPWELLHDGNSFLFQGAKPVRVRRRLPGIKSLDVPVVAPPIRILLVTARPEDESCAYIDHRASALPLVAAMEALPGLVRLTVLDPPTLPSLREELDRVRRQRQPYHVVHFDGHGVYDRRVGLGGLCFEEPQDIAKLERRRHATVYTDELGPLLNEHRIPLVFLEACQTALAEQASESVASELLKVGVASVVAMSHSVLVETARRFVEAFYAALARGARVGDAMLAGQRTLKDDNFRGKVFGLGEFRLEDWFVPVLFQEKDDPQLFRAMPSTQTLADAKTALQTRLGKTPAEPETGFIGRSRELLALQRLLKQERYAVIRGQGGEGKTALAAELARWMVRSQQTRRVAFVSVELHSTTSAVLDAIGRQLVPAYSVASFADVEQAILPVERALKEQSTLLVIDNMESILMPPYLQSSAILTEEAHRELGEILKLLARLLGPKTDSVLKTESVLRIIFTSRESLPEPFAAARNRIELHQLAQDDAVKLVERALNVHDESCRGEFILPQILPSIGQANEFAPTNKISEDTTTESIIQLVEAVHCHARTLALLAPSIRSLGVERTHADLVKLMAEMERRYPGNREQSVYASVELSLRRLSPANQDKVKVLGVFHGGVNLAILQFMMEWEQADVASLAEELITTGLATPNPYNHLSLKPALCPYLINQLDDAEKESLTIRWVETMRSYVEFIRQQHSQNTELAATLTVLELPNLFALLDLVNKAGEPEATIGLTTSLYSLLQGLGKPRLLEQVGRVRDAAATALGDVWNHARFEAQRTRIEQQLGSGRLPEADEGANALLQQARTAGDKAYAGADYDLAVACFLLARVLKTAGGSEPALPLLDEALQGFEAIAKEHNSQAAAGMASACLTERGDCLMFLGRLDEAATAYEEAIRLDEKRGAERDVAVSKAQLGTVRKNQRRYPEALKAYQQAREQFMRLDEPGMVAVSWHQTGMAYKDTGQPEAAEDAYRESLAIDVRLGDVAGQAKTLNQLGILYDDELGRTEEAISFFRQAADKYVEIGDKAKEGMARNNLAMRLRKLHRLAEARQEIHWAIECKAPFGHTSSPWTSWGILADIETDDDNPTAAAEARAKALDCYHAYRRDGGENHSGSGRIALAVTQAFQAGDKTAAAGLLQQQVSRFQTAGYPSFIPALQAIVAGSRDPQLAHAPDLDITMAAEILLLLEKL